MELDYYNLGLKRICDAWNELQDAVVYHPNAYTKREKKAIAIRAAYKLFDEPREIDFGILVSAVVGCVLKHRLHEKTSYFSNIPEDFGHGDY